MKFESHAIVEGCPEFKLNMHSDPLAFDIHGEAGFRFKSEPITAQVSAIPIKLTIPFLRRHCGVVTVASISPFGIRIDPIEAEVQAFGVKLHGMLGKEGMNCRLDGTVACKMAIDFDAKMPGRVTKAAIELAAGDDVDCLDE